VKYEWYCYRLCISSPKHTANVLFLVVKDHVLISVLLVLDLLTHNFKELMKFHFLNQYATIMTVEPSWVHWNLGIAPLDILTVLAKITLVFCVLIDSLIQFFWCFWLGCTHKAFSVGWHIHSSRLDQNLKFFLFLLVVFLSFILLHLQVQWFEFIVWIDLVVENLVFAPLTVQVLLLLTGKSVFFERPSRLSSPNPWSRLCARTDSILTSEAPDKTVSSILRIEWVLFFQIWLHKGKLLDPVEVLNLKEWAVQKGY